MRPFFGKQTWIIWMTALAVVAGLGAAMLSYTGPNRTRTEDVIVCKIVLWECQHVPAKGDWRYHQVRDWSCSNESKPWLDKPSQPPPMGCYKEAAGSSNQYWTREESIQNIPVTYPPAEIGAQPVCGLAGQNGWCRGGGGLQLNGHEPVSGYNIFSLGVVQNGDPFVVENTASAVVPALEGQNNFQYWAYSTWGDTSLMGTSTFHLDSLPPQVAVSSLVGTPGDNGWYVSEVDISVSFSDPTPGSGLDGVTYILNGDTPQPFTSPLTLADGQHEVLIRAADLAGNLSELSQTVKVDTIPPHLEDALEGTLFDGWYAKTATLSASASDAGSGLAGMEVSLNGGGWTAYTAPLVIGDGQHQAVFRARDLAGNLSVSAPLPFKVDARGPRIDLPENWNIWDTAAFAVRDGESGLAEVEVILSDPQGRWPSVKRTYTPSGSRYDGQIGWNRRFSDDTLAPEGQYRVTVKASDLAGNFSQKQATITIPAGELPTEGTIVQPVVEAEDPPVETTFALPPEEPQPVFEPVESVFGGTSLALINEAWQANSLAAVPPLAGPDGILWGAGALAAMAAMTAYYEQKRREEEEAQRAAVHAQFAAEQAEKERQQKAQAKVMAKLEKQWAEEKFKEQAFEAWKAEEERKKNVAAALLAQAKDTAAYYSAQAAAWLGIDKYIEKPKMPTGVSAETQQAFLHGGAAAQGWIHDNKAKLQDEHKAQQARWAEEQAQYAANQAYAALREKGQSITVAAPKEKPWWETTVDFIDNHQTGASIGVGAVVGLAAIGITLAVVGAVTWPVLLVAAGVAAVAAGVAVATGTVALNTHYERPPETNIWDNIKAGAVTAAAFTGVGLFLVGGLLTSTVIGAGNAIASACAANPVACAKAGAVLGLVDPLEELVLNGQLLIETVTGNPHAAETALELQFEQMDGGAPGNTAFFKIQQVFMRNADEVAGFIKKYGDDAFRYLNKVVDVDLANVNLEQGYVVSKLAQELDIPITITGRWADTPAEALLRERASDELKVLVSQGVNIDLAKVQIGQKYGINPHQVKVSTGDPEVDVFIPREAWDKLLPEQQAKIAEELKIFNVDNDPKFKVDFYQNLSLERIELGWPDPQTNIPPGSIIFSPDGTVTHEPFVFP